MSSARTLKRLIAAAALGLCAHMPAGPNVAFAARGDTAPAPLMVPPPPDELALVLDQSQRMTVPVRIDRAGPFPFIVDTGAERTVIARELGERLTLRQGGELRLASLSGPLQTPSFHIDDLMMDGVQMLAVHAPALGARHIGAAGLIGVDSLQNRRVIFDFRRQRMEMHSSKRNQRPTIRDSDAIVVVARRKTGRLILSDARINGRRVDLIVDTGAQTSIGNMALRRLVVDDRQTKQGFANASLMSVTGTPVNADATVLKRISLAGIEVNDLPIAFADAYAFKAMGLDTHPAMLLGMDALTLFDRVEIDFANCRVVLDLPDRADRPQPQRLAAR